MIFSVTVVALWCPGNSFCNFKSNRHWY